MNRLEMKRENEFCLGNVWKKNKLAFLEKKPEELKKKEKPKCLELR